jgi:hypothetical protein
MVASPDYAKLVIGSEDQTLAEIEPLIQPIRHLGKELSLSDRQLKQFGAIFQHVPSLASNLMVATSNTYVMRFPPEAIQGLADGSLKIMDAKPGGLRGIIVDAKTNKFFKHVSLHEAESLKFVAGAVIAWQILALMTAQHYLPEITTKLDQIQQGIEEVKDHMESGDHALIQSIVKQMESIARFVDNICIDDQLATSNLSTLDSNDRECSKITFHYLEKMEQYSSKFNASSFSGFAGADFKKAVDQGLKYVFYAEIAIKSLFLQVMSASFRLAIPGQKSRATYLLEKLYDNELEKWNQLQAEFFPVFHDKIVNDTNSFLPIDSVAKLFGQKESMAQARSDILKGAIAKRDYAMDLYRELKASMQEKIDEASSPSTWTKTAKSLLVEVDDNHQVIRVGEYQES